MLCGHILTMPSTRFLVSEVSQTHKILLGPPSFRLAQIRGGEFSTRVLPLHGAGVADL